MTMQETSHLLPRVTETTTTTRPAWKTAVVSFLVGVALTLMSGVTSHRRTTASLAVPRTLDHSPALHYFAKASTEFASTLPPLPPNIDDSFLADLVTR